MTGGRGDGKTFATMNEINKKFSSVYLLLLLLFFASFQFRKHLSCKRLCVAFNFALALCGNGLPSFFRSYSLIDLKSIKKDHRVDPFGRLPGD